MIKHGKPREVVISRIEDKTSKILAAHDKGIYSEGIRQKQLKEMDLLIDHYCKLLNAEGEDYPALILHSYQTQEYTNFLEKLTMAEKEVHREAQQTIGTDESAGVVASMEEAVERERLAEAGKIFGTTEDAE